MERVKSTSSLANPLGIASSDKFRFLDRSLISQTCTKGLWHSFLSCSAPLDGKYYEIALQIGAIQGIAFQNVVKAQAQRARLKGWCRLGWAPDGLLWECTAVDETASRDTCDIRREASRGH